MDLGQALGSAMLLLASGCTYDVILGSAQDPATAPGRPISAPSPGLDSSAEPSDAPRPALPAADQTPAALPSGAMPAMSPGPKDADPDAATASPLAASGAPVSCGAGRVSYDRPCHDDPDPCMLASGYIGDEYCLVPPPPEAGVQIHLGPDDYADPGEVARYRIEPGTEFDNSVLRHIPLPEDRYFYRTQVSMRPTVHHWTAWQVAGQGREGRYADMGCGGAVAEQGLATGARLIYDNPPPGAAAPENVGLGMELAPGSSICVNHHIFNLGESPQLVDIWINLYFVDASELTQMGKPIAMTAGSELILAPGDSGTLSHDAAAPNDGRVVQLFGHSRLPRALRIAAWLNDDLIFDTWDREESVLFNYDSVTQNPPLDIAGMTGGAPSGGVAVKAGDVLRFACFIVNEGTSELRAQSQRNGGPLCSLWGRSAESEIVSDVP